MGHRPLGQHLGTRGVGLGDTWGFHDQLPLGWGGVIPFMFLCTHRQDVPATS